MNNKDPHASKSDKQRERQLMEILLSQTSEEKCVEAIRLHDLLTERRARLDELKELAKDTWAYGRVPDNLKERIKQLEAGD